jgi:hypothetical protein
VQVLPQRATHRAGDSDVVLEAGPTALDSEWDQLTDDGAAFDPKLAVILELEVFCRISYDEATKALVTD